MMPWVSWLPLTVAPPCLAKASSRPPRVCRVGAHVAGHEGRVEAELEAGQLEQCIERRDGEVHHDLGTGRLQRGDRRADVDVGGHVGLPADHLGVRDLHVQALDAVLAELVVLVEVADLLAREVLLDVGAEDLALADIVELPAEGVRVGGRVVPAVAPGRDEQVRHLAGVEVLDHGQVRGCAQAVEDREDVVLEHELVHHGGRLGRVVSVIEVGVLDLAPEDASVRVDVLEIRVGGRGDLAVAGSGRPGQGLVAADENLGAGNTRGRRGRPAARAGAARTAGTAAGGDQRGGHRGGDDRQAQRKGFDHEVPSSWCSLTGGRRYGASRSSACSLAGGAGLVGRGGWGEWAGTAGRGAGARPGCRRGTRA